MEHILFLEDEQILGEMYKKHLERQGFHVLWVQNSTEFLEQGKNFPADIIVLDQGLKGDTCSGLELIPEAKKMFPSKKIIMLSNYSHFDIGQKAKELGVEKYLLKIDTPPAQLTQELQKL